jgi:hypothetical protein
MVKIFRFGKTGRIAKIAQRACEATFSNPDFYTYQRNGGYLRESTNTFYKDLESCLSNSGTSKILVIDASIDHSNIESLEAHENFKREKIMWLSREGLLCKVIGFSSGIALLNLDQIASNAFHMRLYREKKLIQQDYFSSLRCQIYLPNIFTLVGPITYSHQAVAWAQVLKSRLISESNFLINEPYTKRLWVSEHRLFTSLMHFMRMQTPRDVTGPLIEGIFTLDQIATENFDYGISPLKYKKGNKNGWLIGDYSLADLNQSLTFRSINSELLRSICY